MSTSLQLTGLPGIPEVAPGHDLPDLLLRSVEAAGLTLRQGDVLAIAQKVVSKQEGRLVDLRTVTPGAEAQDLAGRCGKDPALVELVLREGPEVVRCVPGVLIVRHRLGYVLANAGIDQSNVPGAEHHALLLPQDPDASAARLRGQIHDRIGVNVGVLINDSFGRAWRQGVCGTCIGAAGFAALLDERGRPDRFGRPMRHTQVGVGDELAAAASLIMGQCDEGVPAVLARGLDPRHFIDVPAAQLVRPRRDDLFT